MMCILLTGDKLIEYLQFTYKIVTLPKMQCNSNFENYNIPHVTIQKKGSLFTIKEMTISYLD